MKSGSNNKSGLSREKWLKMAFDAMSHSCISKFNLDSLIKAMPVSKGSFYWHFKNREDFLFALVDYWNRHETDSVIQALEALDEGVSAERRLWELMCVVYEFKNTRYDLLIRSLSLEFPELKQAVEKADMNRFETVRQLLGDMGFVGDELEMRTHVFVTTTSLDQFIYPEPDQEAYRRQLKLRHEFFIRP